MSIKYYDFVFLFSFLKYEQNDEQGQFSQSGFLALQTSLPNCTI